MENVGKGTTYLTVEDVLMIARKHVGSYQILNRGSLDYLVEVVGQSYDSIELFPTLTQKAAVYAHHIIRNHVFLDGNKRIGMTCALTFLQLNGCHRLLGVDDEIIELGLQLANGTITEMDEVAVRLEACIL